LLSLCQKAQSKANKQRTKASTVEAKMATNVTTAQAYTLGMMFNVVEPEKVMGGSKERQSWMEAMLAMYAYLLQYVGKEQSNAFRDCLTEDPIKPLVASTLAIGINYEGGFVFSRDLPIGNNTQRIIQDYMEDEAETALDHILLIKNNQVEDAFDCRSEE
jgi:hypothetical protein